MGSVHRFAYCQECEARLSRRFKPGEKPETCPKCGGGSFSWSEWYIRYTMLDQRPEEKVGNLELAKRVLRKREDEVAQGKFRIHRQRHQQLKTFLLGDYLELHVESNLAESTARNRMNVINGRLVPDLGEFWLHRITRRDIMAWIARLRKETSERTGRRLRPATVNRYTDALRSALTVAQELKLIDEHPMRGMEKLAEENERVRWLTREEYHRLIGACEGNELLRAAVALAVGTGLRKSNLFGLTWSRIDLENRVIRITEGTKGNKTLEVPISPPVAETLAELPRGLHTDYVLHKPTTGDGYRDMRTAFEKLVVRAGVEDFTWHDLRHTFASWFVMAGGDLYVLQDILGHSTPTMTKRYAHLSPTYRARQVDMMADFFNAEDVAGIQKKEKM